MLLPKNNHWKGFWLFLIIIFNVLDIWTTYLNVALLKGRELSPLVDWFIEKVDTDTALLLIVPTYKTLMIAAFWFFLTYIPYSHRPLFKIFPKLRKIEWVTSFLARYRRFVLNLGYVFAYSFLFFVISAVVFNINGATQYLIKQLTR